MSLSCANLRESALMVKWVHYIYLHNLIQVKWHWCVCVCVIGEHVGVVRVVEGVRVCAQ